MLRLSGTTIMLAMAASMASGEAPLRVFPTTFSEAQFERMRRDAAFLLDLDPEAIAAMVPVQGGMYFSDCPACDKAAQDSGNWDWTPRDPGRIVCKDCGAAFPDNPDFPEPGITEVQSGGRVHRYPYHERADGYRIYLRARADDLTRIYLAARAADLARLWWATRDEVFAQRGAAILVRFAEVYPGYCVRYDHPFRPKIIQPADFGTIPGPTPVRTAKWSWWGYMDLSRELAEAYDILRHWEAFAGLAGGTARERVETDLLGDMLERTLGFPETYSNMAPTKWRAAIEAGRVLGRPEAVHTVVDRLESFLASRFHYDGSWYETSPSYGAQVHGNLQVIETALSGYADPSGYRHPATGRSLRGEDVAALLAKRHAIAAVLDRTRFPDGRLLPVNDTWSTQRRRPRERTEPVLEPGFGVAFMGGGEGVGQVVSYLNYTSGASHNQWATLTIGLWAHGRELLSDIGYTHTAYRYWTMCTPSHSTVTVDGRDQRLDRDYTGNRLRLRAAAGGGLQVAEAESFSAYPHLQRFRRTLLTIGNTARDTYLVDIFQVHGGSRHDYILAGNADEPATVALDVPLHPFAGTLPNEGVRFTLPTQENDLNRPETGLGFITGLRSGPAAGLVRLDTRMQAAPAFGVRSWFDAEPETTVFLGEAPAIRGARESDGRLGDHHMPMFIARREGEALVSTFVAVHEPVGEAPGIDAVAVDRGHAGAIRVTVTRQGVIDHLLVALDEAVSVEVDTAAGPLRIAGRVGLVRATGDRATAGVLVGGTLLQCGEVHLAGAPSHTGTIHGVWRGQGDGAGGGFDVAESIPAEGNYGALLVHLPDGRVQGYTVVGVQPREGGSRILVRESPGFERTADGARTVFFPLADIPGGETCYELHTVRRTP